MQTYKARLCALVAVTLAVVACGEKAEDTPDAGTPDAIVPDASVPDAISLDVEEHPGVSSQQARIKAEIDYAFGSSVALSASGDTLAAGGDGSGPPHYGAYVFARSGSAWTEETPLPVHSASSVALSASGDTLAACGYGGGEITPVYVFTRREGTWTQEVPVSPGVHDLYGASVALSASGDTLAVGQREIGDDKSGAVYVFTRTGGTWTEQARVKASNTGAEDYFGESVALNESGDTLAVGAPGEASNATGVDDDQADNSAEESGAVYVFKRTDGTWDQQAYVKASNTDAEDIFGRSVALSASGDTLAVGAPREDSSATGMGGGQDDNSAPGSGAVYVFTRTGSTWAQEAYVKAANTDAGDDFGWSVALTASGDTLAVGGWGESSSATGVDGDQHDNSAEGRGAVYVFRRTDGTWDQQAYVKASNTGEGFGWSVALSASGDTLAVGAPWDDSSTSGSGAVYVFH